MKILQRCPYRRLRKHASRQSMICMNGAQDFFQKNMNQAEEYGCSESPHRMSRTAPYLFRTIFSISEARRKLRLKSQSSLSRTSIPASKSQRLVHFQRTCQLQFCPHSFCSALQQNLFLQKLMLLLSRAAQEQ